MADAGAADAQQVHTANPCLDRSTDRGVPMSSSDLLAQRYGLPGPRRSRGTLMVLLVVFVVVGVAFAIWGAASRERANVYSTDLGLSEVRLDSVTVTFQISLPPGRTAACTVRAVNAGLVEVGRKDIRVGPSENGQVRTSVTLRTTERAHGGGVKACVLD